MSVDAELGQAGCCSRTPVDYVDPGVTGIAQYESGVCRQNRIGTAGRLAATIAQEQLTGDVVRFRDT